MPFIKSAIASAALLFGGAVASTPDTADAQIRFSIGSGYGYGHNHGYNNYGYGNYGLHHGHNHGSWGYGGYGGGWHDTSHYDYHPTTIYRHRNHYHVQPGHWDYHRQGHWH